MKVLREQERDTPIAGECDVVVCGAGPAGFAAALSAARMGARTTLLEVSGCLGGVWTAGALSRIIETDKPGVMAELTEILDARGARADRGRTEYSYDVEMMKVVLEELACEAGVRVQMHTRAVAAHVDESRRLSAVASESKSGRQAWTARAFVDATGDGDVGALAGCGYDYGHPETGDAQPMSLMALLMGPGIEEIDRFVAGGKPSPRGSTEPSPSQRYRGGTRSLLEEIERAGVKPSYKGPTLWAIHEDLFAMMANHEYGASALSAGEITEATIAARSELHRIVNGLRSLGGPWARLKIVATADQIGVREGRRIHGRYTVTVDDLVDGRQHEDAVCRARWGVDVHALSAAEGGYLSAARETETSDGGRKELEVRPYDIPLRALIARDVDGLLMAGRCISGDFLAHSSYRVTGNAVAMGQAAGVTAALSATGDLLPHEVPWEDVAAALQEIDLRHPTV
ncbi:FAD-dependent oxidoreductase [Phytoactinopolyspora halotolerans]|uniref:FAD-dependent oxidoreductase n=1 Tax=Phytoactinopolyspora halotolerans TaxID=1981512 RepID=A0A6L9SHZ8_9ACTN|nr:FAD-dependent oxidoreductase [Phytoactinopolyspora halotolerans]NEE03961.1 FAD-dependent oxidoreductase [Phytoactinopolyspora halotolerans]